jgi:type III pantothenate kinase
MKLLVDVGNSRIKWAFGAGGALVAAGETSVGVEASLGAILETGRVPDEIRIANVAGAEAGLRIGVMLKERFGIKPAFARSAAVGAGIRNGYRDPGQLGIDRWLALCGAYVRYRAPVCVVDAGTATTIDLVDGTGEHKGGLILPGPRLMQMALLRGTGDLARLSEGANPDADGVFQSGEFPPGQAQPRIVLGRETTAAIRYGGLQATACLARQCMDELCATLSPDAAAGVLVLTGGAGPDLHAALLRMGGFQTPRLPQGHRLEYRPELVLEGLALDPPVFAAAG